MVKWKGYRLIKALSQHLPAEENHKKPNLGLSEIPQHHHNTSLFSYRLTVILLGIQAQLS
jgi:hypothetical protein